MSKAMNEVRGGRMAWGKVWKKGMQENGRADLALWPLLAPQRKPFVRQFVGFWMSDKLTG
jgi:hypothetical protein